MLRMLYKGSKYIGNLIANNIAMQIVYLSIFLCKQSKLTGNYENIKINKHEQIIQVVN